MSLAMKWTSRSFQCKEDLTAIGNLIRCAYRKSKSLNAWSVCRFDIWAQRRIADVESFHQSGWQELFQLWHDEGGALLAAVFAFDNHPGRNNPHPYCLVLSSSQLALFEAMLAWVEAHDLEPEVEAVDGNTMLVDLLRARGYTRSSDFMAIREKSLTGTTMEPVHLPSGYQLKALEPEDWAAYFLAVHSVFNMMDTKEAFRSIQQGPSNMPDLHLNVIDDQNRIAAFCSVWMDQINNMAEFEPVGTVPGFQKQGLASALIAHVSNRLRKINCPLLKVESWSESPGANRLYTSSGLEEIDRLYSWKKAG
jgi:GNAT superfamily N-acetyltransferase